MINYQVHHEHVRHEHRHRKIPPQESNKDHRGTYLPDD